MYTIYLLYTQLKLLYIKKGNNNNVSIVKNGIDNNKNLNCEKSKRLHFYKTKEKTRNASLNKNKGINGRNFC